MIQINLKQELMKMSDEKESNEKKGFLSRFLKAKDSECACGCCGGIKIVPKAENAEEKTDSDKKN